MLPWRWVRLRFAMGEINAQFKQPDFLSDNDVCKLCSEPSSPFRPRQRLHVRENGHRGTFSGLGIFLEAMVLSGTSGWGP